MEPIRIKAQISVARGCGFACLGILCLMVGLSSNLVQCFAAGGIAMLLMSVVLILKRRDLARRSHKRTELWIMLRPEERPDDRVAKRIIGQILGRTYLEFALHAARASALFSAVSLLFSAIHAR